MEAIMQYYTDQQIVDYYDKHKTIQQEVYDQFCSKAFQTLRRKGATGAITEDMIHDAWVKFLNKILTIQLVKPNALLSYFSTICINNYIAHCKKQEKIRDRNENIKAKLHKSYSNQMEEAFWILKKEELLDRLLAFKEKMDLKCQELFQLRYWKNLSLAEIDQHYGAKNTGTTSSAKNQLYRCRRRLKALMGKYSK